MNPLRRRTDDGLRNRLFGCFLCLCSIATSAQAPSSAATPHEQGPVVQDGIFRSASLARDMHYRVLLPAKYEAGGRFAVLYLLHGLYGDYKNWDTLTGLENYSRNISFIIVMPDADDSWYTNSATVPADRFEDYIGKDLISEIDDKFRTIRDRHARAIAGLSMGGYGSIKFVLKHPELFAVAGSISGALNAAQNLDRLRPEFQAKLLQVFGNEASVTRTENDVFALLSAPHASLYPYFYLACGTDDSFLDTNRELAKDLASRHLPYEYHETPGGHTWEYWDHELRPLLQAVDRVLGNQGRGSDDDVQPKKH
jgi:putative tributyrin esterase